jgi:hypothetical protein
MPAPGGGGGGVRAGRGSSACVLIQKYLLTGTKVQTLTQEE